MTGSNLSYHRYGIRLRAANGANARSGRQVLEGFLIRLDGGYACVQPWPELGDAPLEQLWLALRTGGTTPLLDRARECAAADAEARRQGRSLFEGLTVPRSHATVVGEADFAALRAEGFETVKLKGGRNWKAVADRVREAAAAGLRVRVDFNGVLTGPEFIEFTRAADDVRGWVDFAEDPVPYAADAWEQLSHRTGWRLALDRAEGEKSGGFDVRVVKPAVEAMPDPSVPVVVTSNMDHPVGQAFAAWQAGRYGGAQEHAGLLTHQIFEPDAFGERLTTVGPEWRSPGGTGLGFDDLLEALPWVGLDHRTRLRSGRVWQNPRDPLPQDGPVLEAGQVGFATSGSTGRPSVVVHTPESLDASSLAVNQWLGVRAEDVWLRVLPDFHVGGFQIHTRSELSGSRVVVDEGKWDAARFVRICQQEAVTLTSLVPAQVVDLVGLGAGAPPAMRAVVVGGGALEEPWLRQARECGWPVLPSYGATEAASQVATARLGGIMAPGGREMELLPTWEARVITGGGSAASDGHSGLLQLRGPALAVAKFIWDHGGWCRNPLRDEAGWWHTQDIVVLTGRQLRCTGRSDRVVKVLGELVNLAAVERDLADAGLPPGHFAVIALPHERRGMELVLTLEHGVEAWEPVLAAYRTLAPPFARVDRIVRLPALPRSPLGKVKYAELPALVRPALPG